MEKDAPLFQIPANKLMRAAKCKPRGEHPINLPKYFDKLKKNSQMKAEILLLTNLSTKYFVERYLG